MPVSESEAAAPAVEVATGIYRVALPVPFRALGAVNGYVLRRPGGWDLVDTGLGTPAAHAAWQSALRHLDLGVGGLRQIVLTHHHPDHMGLAGFFQQAARAASGRRVPVRASAREAEIVEIIWTDRHGRDAVLEDFLARCGVPDAAEANFSAREIDGMRRALEPFPDGFEAIAPGEAVEIGGRRFEAILTPGHSDGHLAFFDAGDGVLLAGDHVLPHITPNIARWPGVEPDPLGRFLGSLEALHALPVRRALPGHGSPLGDWRGRLRALAAHHAHRLGAMQDAAGDGATAYAVTRRVFRHRTLDRHELRMAVVETLAHLEHLVAQGALGREDRGGAWWFVPA